MKEEQQMPPTVTERPSSAVTVLPFGIEADHPRNCDLLIQCIPNCRLRSAIDGVKGHMDEDGNHRVPVDQARHLGAFPRTPGMQLHVDPEHLTYEIIDPMYNNEALCERVRKYLKEQTGFTASDKLNGAPPQKGTLDVHRMKSLVREMYNIVKSGEAKKCKGALPEMDDINDLPGHYLLNPGMRVPTMQPVYEKDWDDWVSRLSLH